MTKTKYLICFFFGWCWHLVAKYETKIDLLHSGFFCFQSLLKCISISFVTFLKLLLSMERTVNFRKNTLCMATETNAFHRMQQYAHSLFFERKLSYVLKLIPLTLLCFTLLVPLKAAKTPLLNSIRVKWPRNGLVQSKKIERCSYLEHELQNWFLLSSFCFFLLLFSSFFSFFFPSQTLSRLC